MAVEIRQRAAWEDGPDRLLQRAVFVLDPSNTIRHVEYFQDQGIPPNYEPAHAKLHEIVAKQ